MSSGSDFTKAQTFFNYGNDAAMKQNFEYAIQMYREACKLDVENLLYRAALRGIEKKKFGNDPSKVGRLAGAKNQPIRLRARASKAKSNWKNVLEICEEAFVNNPWDLSVSRDAAEAAEQLGYNGLAQWLVEAVQAQATDAEFFRFAGHIHEINESWPKAIACWEKVKKLDPNDENANRQINGLSAQASIKRSGISDAIDKRDETPAGPGEAELEEMKAQKLSPEERYQKEILEEPTRISSYLQLADLFKLRGQLEEAEKVMARGLKANPGNRDLAFAHAEIQISRIQGAIDRCHRRLAEKPDDEKAKAKLEEFTTLLNDYQIKEFRRRLALQPEDMGIQLELGIRLAQAGKHDEAIAAFQQARSSADHKVKALHQSGLSFESKGSLKLAERMYQDALKAADSTDMAVTNALHYRLGRVAEAQGNPQVAEEHYNEVAANDYNYLDVAQRLQSLN
ncbi:Tetratricopeptide repeat-containing protein [Singulisphaera sp. GP187]|uniref:tetratricopeptide repeat protein n=1 Tax=Singulisphaera sp. GP187 TaxID=1882752 RepID=UPI00092CA112|nr:tetratricopeptide repeat protein [Singulisphaera sp. GP187]SIN76054.1 Tetratricopeptide repeat-containing protein [Singulisphaera sp. GP187]